MNKLVAAVCPLLLASVVIPLTASGQSVAEPNLGFVFDAVASGIRPISGIPGAAWQGQLVSVGSRISRAFISPSNRFALIEPEGAAVVAVAMLSSASPIQILNGVDRDADSVVFSVSGSAALLYSRSSARIQVIAGLPQSPSVSSVDLSTLPTEVSALAIDDQGTSLLVGTTDAGNGSLFVVPVGSGAFQLIAAGLLPGAAGFVGSNEDAVVADGTTGRLTLIRNVTTRPSLSVVAETSASGFTALRISNDAKRAVLLNQKSGDLKIVDLLSGAFQSVACACHAGDLHRLAGNAVFLVGLSAQQLPLALDADGPTARLVFIPDLDSRRQGRDTER